MKAFLFAAALTVGSTAFAQTVDHPSMSTGPRGVTQQGTVPDGKACMPASHNNGNTVYPTCPTEVPPPKLPLCSKIVKDGCLQAYERGRPH